MMKKKTKYFGLIIDFASTIIILIVIQNTAFGQFNYIRNGSMNGVVGNMHTPIDWYVCDSYSSPDIYSVYTPDSSGLSDVIFPVRDSTLLFIRTRGKYHTNSPGPYTNEYIVQRLKEPLEKDSTYEFGFFYCFNSHLKVQDLRNPDIVYPVRLELWVGTDSCAHEKLLMQTEPLQDIFWTERHCTFTVFDTSYSYIRIEAQWDSMTMNVHHESYNGMILLDSLSIYKVPGIDTTKTFDVYYKGDGKTTLHASQGTSYSWLPQENLSNYNIQSPTMQGFTKKYTVAEGSLTTCSTIEIFNIILNCDSIYPRGNLDSFDVYYNPRRKVVLKASAGLSYDWNPKAHLSDSNSCCPYLTGYDSIVRVTVWDRNSCSFNEKFLELLNCDTIVPNKNILTLDTLVGKQSTIRLVPSYGEVEGNWNPFRWLDCQSCREPNASPMSSVTYRVMLKDTFGCRHQESFNIAIEIFVPNIITPNGDSKNECFRIYGLPDNTTLKIYTKNGILVYMAKPYNDSNCWKGNDNSGKPLESNTYWYVLENPDKGLLLKGFVFLMR
jgi:gliding motility-associated-like protein